MNHTELGPSTIVGIVLIMMGLLLYALRSRELHVSRYYDFLFSAIGLLCGGILFFQGWRLDPILLLSQILLSGTSIFFVAESIYLRSNSDQAESRVEKTTESSIHFDGKSKYIYQNLKSKNRTSKQKWDGIHYAAYVFYEEGYR
uniref:hypothetical chloroplast RF66 n=1 Tax=Fossombronia foveolata TaxID=56918 RepID=UPI00257F9933|nr:hypothetical chloroplast RF66 [Fossombronia foveolata]WIA67191.1 hypothetical chloroplast RF66 [Fossombronia foveolata]